MACFFIKASPLRRTRSAWRWGMFLDGAVQRQQIR